jgi:hypothetical protein
MATADPAAMGKRKTILLVAASIVVLVIVAALLALLIPPPPHSAEFPSPNGYDAFVWAGTLVQNQTSEYTKMTPEVLRTLVEANSNAMQVVRLGLSQKSRVPMGLSEQSITNHIVDLQRMKNLAYALLAEGRLAELEQRTNDAVRAYLDVARLGIKLPRGGETLDALVGVACESMGTSQLENMMPNLDAKTSADLALQLEDVDVERETWAEIMRDEKYWSRRRYPGVEHRITEIVASAELKAVRQKAGKKYGAQQGKTYRLILNLAAHAYQLDKGHRPTTVADLVPSYLKAAPIDPVTGKEMSLSP